MIKNRTLKHQQTYEYKVHLPKLEFMASTIPHDVATKVKHYLFSVFVGFPDELFQDDKQQTPNLDEHGTPEQTSPPVAMRSSKARFEVLSTNQRASSFSPRP
jgi:hypothetical protein